MSRTLSGATNYGSAIYVVAVLKITLAVWANFSIGERPPA
jgi:hypothetical protein